MTRLWQRFWTWARYSWLPLPEEDARFRVAEALESAQLAAEQACEDDLLDAINTLTVLWAAGFEAQARQVLDRVAAPLLAGGESGKELTVMRAGAGPEASAPSAPPEESLDLAAIKAAAEVSLSTALPAIAGPVVKAAIDYERSIAEKWREELIQGTPPPPAWGVIYDRSAPAGSRYAASPLPDAGTGHPFIQRSGRARAFSSQRLAEAYAWGLNCEERIMWNDVDRAGGVIILLALLFTSACSPAGADASKRTVTLTATDRPLSEVIDQAARQVGCNLRSRSGVGNEPVTLSTVKSPLAPMLDAFKQAYGLTWRIDDRGLGCDLWVERPNRPAPRQVTNGQPVNPAPFHRPRWRVRACRDTRAQVLAARCREVRWGPDGCYVIAARCAEPYTGREIRTTAAANELAIDHLVPAAVAWKRRLWPAGEYRAFFDDARNLVITTPALNDEKSDRMPDSWCPPDPNARPTVAAQFRAVVAAYGIPLTPAEESGLARWSVGLCAGGGR